MSRARFEPGEVAILKTGSSGGRLFVVHMVTNDGGVIERHSIPGQQKYVEPRPPSRLIKVASADLAHELMGRIKEVIEQRDAAVRKIHAKAEKRLRSLGLDYEVEESDG